MSSSGCNKRRRTAADTLHISDLPIGFIADVSAYLSKPSRAILAVAFSASASSSSWKNNNNHLSDISTAIVSAQQWDILDFEDIEKELAKKLTDDDIYAVLKCINAQDVLKRLKLCGCINITGIGLYPLRGSAVLEQIDLGLVGKYDRPQIKPELKISQEVIISVLDSIISSDECSLKHIMFPQQWRDAQSESLNQFRTRYNTFLANLELNCAKCNAEMSISFGQISMLQNNVCYDCLKPFCGDCADENGEGRKTLNYCFQCEKDFCVDCVSRAECTECLENMCSGCLERTCQECNQTMCVECLNICNGCNKTRCTDCGSHRHCEGDNCYKSHCVDCYNGKEYDIKWCEKYKSHYCTGCVDKKTH